MGHYPVGHSNTDIDRWLALDGAPVAETIPYTVPYTEGFEPYVVAS